MSLAIRDDTYARVYNGVRVRAQITQGWICLGDKIRLTPPSRDLLWCRVRELIIDDRFAFAAITGDIAYIYFEPLDKVIIVPSQPQCPDEKIVEPS